jgi:hypothetical protein
MRGREGSNANAPPREISRRAGPNRNGGRHCCQPPLRRAKDLPVFVTWSIENPKAYQPALDPGSPAQASPPILPLPLARSPAVLLDCAARRFAGLSACPAWLPETSDPKTDCLSGPKPPDVLRPFLGNPLSRPALLTFPVPSEEVGGQEPRRATGRFLFRRLFPAGPSRTRKFFPLPAGGDRTFGHLPRPSHPCGHSGEAGTAVPIT